MKIIKYIFIFSFLTHANATEIETFEKILSCRNKTEKEFENCADKIMAKNLDANLEKSKIVLWLLGHKEIKYIVENCESKKINQLEQLNLYQSNKLRIVCFKKEQSSEKSWGYALFNLDGKILQIRELE